MSNRKNTPRIMEYWVNVTATAAMLNISVAPVLRKRTDVSKHIADVTNIMMTARLVPYSMKCEVHLASIESELSVKKGASIAYSIAGRM